VNTIAPVAASIVAVPDGGPTPIAHVKGPEPEDVAGLSTAAVFTVVVALTSPTVGAAGLVTVIVTDPGLECWPEACVARYVKASVPPKLCTGVYVSAPEPEIAAVPCDGEVTE
jgi:hypothetical protein